MSQYPFLASRIFGTPLLIHPDKLQIILNAIGPRIGIDVPAIDARMVENDERRSAGYRIEEGVGIIPIYGTLVSRGSWMDAMSGVTGYNNIAKAVRTAEEDDAVKSILYDIDSPGGEADLVDSLANLIFESRNKKPSTAIANESAFSAAMWLASAAGTVVAPRTATVGSIGVVMTHMSIADAAEKAGIVVTHIHAGARKVDFSPYQHLQPEAVDTAQALVNNLYEIFTGEVARNRGMDQDAVKATEAGIFSANDALKIGLIDRIASYDETLAAMQASANQQSPPMRSIKMSDENAMQAAVTAERQRSTAITQAAQAAGCPDMAATLINEGVTIEQAQAKISQAGEIIAACKMAGCPDSARSFVKAGLSIQDVRSNLFDVMAARDAATHTDGGIQAGQDHGVTIQAGWDRAIKKVCGSLRAN